MGGSSVQQVAGMRERIEGGISAVLFCSSVFNKSISIQSY